MDKLKAEKLAAKLKAHENALREIVAQLAGDPDHSDSWDALRMACDEIRDAESIFCDEVEPDDEDDDAE
jgi:hypothetical protein